MFMIHKIPQYAVEEIMEVSAQCDNDPLTSDGHHLSYDDCLEDKREDYHKCSAVLFTTIVHSYEHTHMSSSYR